MDTATVRFRRSDDGRYEAVVTINAESWNPKELTGLYIDPESPTSVDDSGIEVDGQLWLPSYDGEKAIETKLESYILKEFKRYMHR